jgi:UDP-N-acetyl-D-mannosaminuronic acid transferase (WecB/TagA/CpsF family)
MLSAAKYVIVDGCGIIFSAAIQHKDMVGFNQKATGAGFVHFSAEVDEYGETIIKVNAYGRSVSLGIPSQEGDSAILTRQITNTY